MCGIAAYIGTPDDRVFGMWQHLEKRGPDAFGSWNQGNVNLYHTRLSILDLSPNGNQPMENERWVLVYNGEIYNYKELKSYLPNREWKSGNDAEVLLHYIDAFGIYKALNDAEGMFSFITFNKATNHLYLAVDAFGIKPLYFYSDGNVFACSSSPASLAHLKDKWEFNRYALNDLIALGGTKESLFGGIRKIHPGHLLVYNDGFVWENEWYQRKEHQCTEDDLIDAVKHSINITKVSDVPSFIFLSGGIDSTVVASQCEHMNAVHLTSPEEEFARQAAVKYHNTLNFIQPKDYSAKECLEDYARQSGDCAMAALQPYIVSKEVSKFGKVAISANGADELFFGYNRMLEGVSITQFNHIFRSGLQHSWGQFSDYKSTRDLELSTYVQYDLNKTLDFASMCHSLEVRVPYLNKSVVEMALSLPRKTHVNGYGNKSILKKFLKREGFSDQFLNRPKIGFSLHSEPADYAHLKVEGIKLLRNEFGFTTKFHNARDARYFEATAAAFYCWYNVWKDKLL